MRVVCAAVLVLVLPVLHSPLTQAGVDVEPTNPFVPLPAGAGACEVVSDTETKTNLGANAVILNPHESWARVPTHGNPPQYIWGAPTAPVQPWEVIFTRELSECVSFCSTSSRTLQPEVDLDGLMPAFLDSVPDPTEWVAALSLNLPYLACTLPMAGTLYLSGHSAFSVYWNGEFLAGADMNSGSYYQSIPVTFSPLGNTLVIHAFGGACYNTSLNPCMIQFRVTSDPMSLLNQVSEFLLPRVQALREGAERSLSENLERLP